MRHTLFTLFFFITTFCGFSQKPDYSVAQIPDSLKQNANAVVRLDQTDIEIISQRKMKIHSKRVVTVLNEKGQEAINAVEFYNKSRSINSIEATIHDASGKEIKRVKRSDFMDQTATDSGTMFSDNRILYLNYTPTEYPFTICFESDTATSNTAFIPSWIPITDYNLAIEKSILNVAFPDNLGFKKSEKNFSGFKISKTIDSATRLTYQAENILAHKPESEGPAFVQIFPQVLLGLELFNLEGVDGNAKTWKEFGKWYNAEILSGTTEIDEETKNRIKSLVGNEQDMVKKAKLVYRYVQDRTRYVSIQVGMGSWKPMYAKDVDRLGYGDCKALTNYTKALLEVVGVPSYNTILYGSRDKRNIDADFVSMQGNHMILSIPKDNGYIWLECTSQDDPFGYQANFTDDRQVLVVTPEGGEIVWTKNYPDRENTQISKGSYTVSGNGAINGKISIVSEGSQYGHKSRIEKLKPLDRDSYYKAYWKNIDNLKLVKTVLSNDREKAAFSQQVEIDAPNYGSITGNSMIFVINAYNQNQDIPQRYRKRNTPLEIERGFMDQDEIEINLPADYTIDAKPDNVEIKGKFGEYKTELVVLNENKLLYKRSFILYKGLFDKSEYENYRKFKESVAKADNSKIILAKKL